MATESQFGPFFRTVRKALGLNLREFCRRNGFDPGNVSRLERGLTPPPKAQDGLEEYAKALKLKPKTERWNQFMELAAAETGRIPSAILEDQAMAANLPKVLRKLRHGPGHRNWVKAQHLEEWANTLEARSSLPQLVRRLVHATGKTITRIEFPAAEQTQRPGLDGVVEANEADAFVPAGKSVWEMGVNKNPGTKAENDFEKRRKQKLGLEKRKTTYIVVTPRKWQTKSKWVEAKNKLGVWKEVRVYDSATLEEWLERAPAVDVWLARLLELRPEGLIDIDEYWENLEALTEPILKPEVFLASREKKVEEFKTWLAGPPSAAIIETRSPSEAVDFVVAAIRESSTREAVTARAVIVEEKEAWRAISRADNELILIAHPNLAVEPEMVAEAVRQGHRVVLSVSQALTDRSFTLELPRVYRHHLQKALEASGIDRTRASEHAGKAGGSLTVLKRLLGKLSGTSRPEWSHGPAASALVPILLAGAWEDTNTGDREILERLSGRPYQEVLSTAERWLGVSDPPLSKVLSRWGLISRDDSWLLLSHAVTREDLERYVQVALDVLGENDPAFDLTPDERWMANIKNKVLGHSRTLRAGIAETLALLGGRSERLAHSTDVPGRVGHIVHRLLHRQSWLRWASLSSELPLVAEASPEVFLKAVEEDFRQKEPALPKLFEQEGKSVLFSSHPYTGLLWALEGVAWDRGLLPQVSYLLARLDEVVEGKNRGNSPMGSLQSVFMPWYPQTTAPVDERVKILSTLTRKYPGTGWRLLQELLPERFRTTSPIRRPAFRDWALMWTEGATNADYGQQVTACADILVESLGQDLAQWQDLIEHFENLAGPAGQKFLDKLLSADLSAFDTNSRRFITEALRAKVTRHRQLAETDWALPETVLAKLDEARRRFEPADAVSQNAWLFNQMWEVVSHEGGKGEEEIAILRRKAIEEIQKEAGWDGILALAQAVGTPEELGGSLGQIASAKEDGIVLPALFSSTDERMTRFAQGYVWGRFRAAGCEWATNLMTEKWTGTDVAKFALLLPFERKTWDLVAGKGKDAEEYYWQNTARSVPNADVAEVQAAISMLLKYHRPFQACFALGMARHKKCPIKPDLVLEVLEAGLKGPIADADRQTVSNRRHYILELLQYLQKELQWKDSGVDQTRVARIEFGYLEWLNGHPATPNTLHSMLSTDPKFFVDLLGVIFRSDADLEERPEPTDEEKARAQNAFRLLMSWTSVPGSREDKTVDESVLLDWVRKARSMAEGQRRVEVCDSRIGSVFAHSRDEPSDGGWPCIPVRDAIEEIGSGALENGFEVGIYNKRGAHWKSIEAGGQQERGLAKRYRDWAEICKIEWPRTAASLRRMAEGYEREAARADAETQLRLT
jgi:transcriptional regulator with XRE-family HTH domain